MTDSGPVDRPDDELVEAYQSQPLGRLVEIVPGWTAIVQTDVDPHELLGEIEAAATRDRS